MSSGAAVRDDPVNKYFATLNSAETCSDLLYYGTAILSFVAITVSRADQPALYQAVQIGFLIASLTYLVLGVVIRLRLWPRAEDARRKDFLSNAYRVPLSHERSQGYYNNDLAAPPKRIAAQTFENALFTKRIIGRMIVWERVRIGSYAVVWLAILVSRATDIAVTTAIAQVLFSEQLLVRWFRMEWLKGRSEEIYSELFSLFQTGPSQNVFATFASRLFAEYETAKSTAQILLSERIFNELNPVVTGEWESIKKTLGM